ncbi:hypothetical protein E4U43_001546 [Claviceps pusilla]|uniref:Aromatic-L-amino-acid decarboxylase n=1 Tax=Claviceps pusilla TaxID=123648 RepID=A0A9P7N8T3_9HYPO|nr:hypothetical protein E4U43_001546 [Claviceps pusilla]
MDDNQFREAAKAAIEDAIAYQKNVSSQRVLPTVQPGYLARLLPSSPPLHPEPFSSIHADLYDKIMPGMTHWQSPRFMALFPCSTSYPALLAEMYSNVLSGAYFNWICSPAVTELEIIVMNWLAEALGLPECYTSRGSSPGGGVLHGSASEAILTVMVSARDKYIAVRTKHLPDGPDKEDETWRLRSKLVALASTGTHSSTRKAAQILGVRFDVIPTFRADNFALKGQHLAPRLEQLTARGLEPFFLTTTMGTTDLCAVDDFESIADALQQRRARGIHPGIFVHVDAALAGSALLLPEYQPLAKSFAHFNSFNFNPQKLLLTGYDCSATFVRSRADLISAMSVNKADTPYLRNQESDTGLVTDYRDWQIPLSRRFRCLKLWFVMRSYGISGLQAHIQNGITLAQSLERRLRTRPDLFTVFTAAQFGLVTLTVAAQDEEEADARTKRVYDRILAGGEYYLTSTVVDGRTLIRVATGVTTVRDEHIKEVFALLVREAERECLEGGQEEKDHGHAVVVDDDEKRQHAADIPDECPILNEKMMGSSLFEMPIM